MSLLSNPLGFLNRVLSARLRAEGFICRPASDESPNGWGEPFEDENGESIVPGTPGGSNPKRLLRYKETQWEVSKSKYQSGEVDWKGFYEVGKPTRVISWRGPSSRHFLSWFYGSYSEPLRSRYIYEKGLVLSAAPYSYVVGAALTKINDQVWVVAICQSEPGSQHTVYAVRRPAKRSSEASWYDPETKPDGWRLIGSWTPPPPPFADSGEIVTGDSGWFFNGSGTQAASVKAHSKSSSHNVAVMDLVYGEPDSMTCGYNPEGFLTPTTSSSFSNWILVWLAVDFVDNDPVYAYVDTVVNSWHYDPFAGLGTGSEIIVCSGNITRNIHCSGSVYPLLTMDGSSKRTKTWETTEGEHSDTCKRHFFNYIDTRQGLVVSVGASSSVGGSSDGLSITSLLSYSIEVCIYNNNATSTHVLYSGSVSHTYGSYLSEEPVLELGTLFSTHMHYTLWQSKVGAAVDPNNRLFVSVSSPFLDPYPFSTSHDLTKTISQIRTYNELSDGDPVTLTQTPGDNPRFYPITLL